MFSVKSMLRWLLAFCGILALASGAGAATVNPRYPHDGVWELVNAKSFSSPQVRTADPKVSIELRWQENSLDITAIDRTEAQKPKIIAISCTLDDTVTAVKENDNVNEIRVRMLSRDVYQIVEQKDGRVVVGQLWTFSPDGTSFTRWGVSTAANGTTSVFYEWYERRAR